ncbi:hypothetical protein [Mucilaginibacter sp. PAMB04168]|uniref:hypothetical protein n=1 Tax=Mucilaginibacter sp. PAMB04168 TaxID=3138567 RepID=UPI0031F6220D
MYEREYRELVINDFEKKQAAGILPPELIAPTRKSLRDYSVKVCTERYKSKDEPLLRSFFGKRDNPAAYLIAVQNADAESFRTLNNFLRDRSRGTSFINISLLAWMIDFEPRPFHENLKIEAVPVNDPGRIIINEPETKTTKPPTVRGDKEQAGDKAVNFLFSTKHTFKIKWTYVIVLLLFLLTALYFVSKDSAGDKGCMIWTGEKYQQVECNHKSEDGRFSVVPLDTPVLRGFKKILKEDTLTANSIGKVFCVKTNGKYDYYTDSAANPVNPERPLRPLTHFIMNNNE